MPGSFSVNSADLDLESRRKNIFDAGLPVILTRARAGRASIRIKSQPGPRCKSNFGQCFRTPDASEFTENVVLRVEVGQKKLPTHSIQWPVYRRIVESHISTRILNRKVGKVGKNWIETLPVLPGLPVQKWFGVWFRLRR